MPTDQALDSDYDRFGLYQRPHIVRRADEMAQMLRWFQADRPDVDCAVFTLDGAPAEVAIASIKAFRDWQHRSVDFNARRPSV